MSSLIVQVPPSVMNHLISLSRETGQDVDLIAGVILNGCARTETVRTRVRALLKRKHESTLQMALALDDELPLPLEPGTYVGLAKTT